jgi:hypothetical protein
MEVFANGKRIHPEGPHRDEPEHYQPISRIYNLNLDPSETSLTLAANHLCPCGYGSYTSFFANRTLRLGIPKTLAAHSTCGPSTTSWSACPGSSTPFCWSCSALFLLALYFTQKGHIEYLWLALHELLQAPIGFVELAGSSPRWTSCGTRPC